MKIAEQNFVLGTSHDNVMFLPEIKVTLFLSALEEV
jgi:hypothetical protein